MAKFRLSIVHTLQFSVTQDALARLQLCDGHVGARVILLYYCLNSRDLFLNLRRLVKMTKPLRFENKSSRLKYKCLICI